MLLFLVCLVSLCVATLSGNLSDPGLIIFGFGILLGYHEWWLAAKHLEDQKEYWDRWGKVFTDLGERLIGLSEKDEK